MNNFFSAVSIIIIQAVAIIISHGPRRCALRG